MTMHTETETPTTHSAMADGETSVPILQLKDVSYAYAKGGRNVLSDINYTFPSGSVTAIVGPSGAGKTTLLSLISGLTTPTGGEVLFEGHNLPERYANERILHLSGGEQQRVAMARALSTNPQVVIADEPTGNLDPATQDDIMRIFIELAHEQNKCVIIVTHSPQIAERSDRVFQLSKRD